MNEIKGYVTRSVLSTPRIIAVYFSGYVFYCKWGGSARLGGLKYCTADIQSTDGAWAIVGYGRRDVICAEGKKRRLFFSAAGDWWNHRTLFYWTRGLFQSRFGVTFRSKWRNCCVYNNVYALYFGDGAIFYLEQFMSSIYSQRSKSAVGNEGDDFFQVFSISFLIIFLFFQ